MVNHYDEMIPKYLILGLDIEIPKFESTICGDFIPFPVVDIEICVRTIFDVLATSDEETFIKDLKSTADYIGKSNGLFDNARLDEVEIEFVMMSIIYLGMEIKKKVKEFNILLDGFFPYSFHQMLGNRAVALVFSDENYWTD